jgi:NTP pyrophosphatase (non-canonical NTP hydrolase)
VQKEGSINALCQEINAWAESKGWHEEPLQFGNTVALLHTEISEAYEEWRNGRGLTEVYYNGLKPEGVPIELADLAIRLFHACAYYGIDLEEAIKIKMVYNHKRPHRHGGKRT